LPELVGAGGTAWLVVVDDEFGCVGGTTLVVELAAGVLASPVIVSRRRLLLLFWSRPPLPEIALASIASALELPSLLLLDEEVVPALRMPYLDRVSILTRKPYVVEGVQERGLVRVGMCYKEVHC
jgi:hypothetical protein